MNVQTVQNRIRAKMANQNAKPHPKPIKLPVGNPKAQFNALFSGKGN